MTTGEIVRRARERKGLSQSQLAKLSGISQPAICNIEADRVSPKMDTMLTIMRVLDYDIVFKPTYNGGYYR